MNASIYLKSFGWKEGEALQKGGLKKPILVKHKKDTKGLGHDTNDSDMWWEKLFDGQLKSLEVNKADSGEYTIKQNEESIVSHIRKETSVLYRMFVKGEGLAGTVGKDKKSKSKKESSSIDKSKSKSKSKDLEKLKTKVEKKEKKDKKEKKEKKDKKEKKVKDRSSKRKRDSDSDESDKKSSKKKRSK
ncbi:uncharacterized protein RJT21DRAFT_100906 [Scheffersomyces amazonensis]|uniref:uncharacterized protein n=1 Tax=Scheffersomyces amazonensis TaxID=1078765 RepID=UPI00315C56B6